MPWAGNAVGIGRKRLPSDRFCAAGAPNAAGAANATSAAHSMKKQTGHIPQWMRPVFVLQRIAAKKCPSAVRTGGCIIYSRSRYSEALVAATAPSPTAVETCRTALVRQSPATNRPSVFVRQLSSATM